MKRMTRILIALSVAAVLFGLWTVFRGPALRWYYTSRAASALEENRPERAAELMEKRLAMSPKDDELRLRLAGLLADNGFFSRAEHLLNEGLTQSPSPVRFYEALSAVFVRQDKLYDAVELLSGVKNALVGEALAELRPPAPVFDPPGGTYAQLIDVSAVTDGTCVCYVSWEGEIPSTAKDALTEPRRLAPGVTAVRAVAVGPTGLVSGWSTAEYRLENVRVPLAFEDPIIERDVREALGRPDGEIFSDEAAGLTSLVSVGPADYRTLADLTQFPALGRIELTGAGQRCDVSALPLLSGVSELSLTDMGLDSIDLEFVGQMLWLRSLTLTRNQIASLAPLSGLTALETLNLSENSLMELDPLSSLTALRELSLARNAVQDIRPLAALADLEILDLSENRVLSLDGLQGKKRLRVLHADRNYLDGLFELSGLNALEELSAGGNRIESLSPLSGRTALRTLSLPNNAVPSLEALSDLSSLETLDVSSNTLTSLTGLGGCAALRLLLADKNALTGVEPLRGLAALEEVHVEGNAVKSLLPLKECPSLKTVYAFGNSLTDDMLAFAGTQVTVYRN